MQLRLPLVAWLLGFACIAPAVAQDSAQQWHTKARELGKANKLAEADDAYRKATDGYDKLLKENDVTRETWKSAYQCRFHRAALETQMERFTEASKKNYLLTIFPGRAGPFGLAQAHQVLGDTNRAMELSASAVRQYDKAIGYFREFAEKQPDSREAREELATVLGHCAQQHMNLARYPDGEAAYRECLQIWHKLIVDHPKVPEYRERLAMASNDYAILAREAGRFLLARDLLRSSIQIAESLAEALPREPKYWYGLPTFYRNIATPLDYLHCKAEKAAAQRATDRWQRRVEQASDESMSWVAEGHKILGSAQARELDRLRDQPAVDAFLKKAEADTLAHPDIPYYRGRWVALRLEAAARLVTTRSFDKALTMYREALADHAAMIRACPDAVKYRRLSASAQAKMGLVLCLAGDDQEGAKQIDASFAAFRKLADDYPDEPKLRRALDEEMTNIMMFHLSRGDNQKVIDMMRLTTASLGKLCERYPRCPEFRRYHAQSPVALGHIHAHMKNDAASEQAFKSSLQLWTKVVEDFPETAEFMLFQCQVRSTLVQFYFRKDRFAEAEPLVREMQRSHQKVIEAIPAMAHQHTGLAVSQLWLATLATRQRKVEQAVDHYCQAIAICEKAFAALPSEREHLTLWCSALRERAALYQLQGNFAAYDRDLKLARDLSEWLETPFVRLTRIGHRLGSGEAESARRDADDLFDCGELTATQWFELAGLYARLLKTGDPANQGRYATRTIVSLRKALDDGYRPTTPLSNDGQFRMLAGHPEFQQLALARP